MLHAEELSGEGYYSIMVKKDLDKSGKVVNLKSSKPIASACNGPRRMKRVLREHESEMHRFLDCVYYDRCLTDAAEANWKSFTCKDCGLMELME